MPRWGADKNGSIAPQMLLIADGDGSWEWPTEHTKISDAYHGFSDWVSDRNNSTWLASPAEGLVTKKQQTLNYTFYN